MSPGQKYDDSHRKSVQPVVRYAYGQEDNPRYKSTVTSNEPDLQEGKSSLQPAKMKLRQHSYPKILDEKQRLSVVPENEAVFKHRPRNGSTEAKPNYETGSNVDLPSSLIRAQHHTLFDNRQDRAEQKKTDGKTICKGTKDFDFQESSLTTNYQESSSMYDSVSLQRQATKTGFLKRTRRHTLSELHRPHWHQHLDPEPDPKDGATAGGYSTLQGTPHDGAMSPREADRKRSAFLKYLEQRYPQHAGVISGKSTCNKSSLSHVRTRASYAADNSYFSAGQTSSSNDSEVTRYGSLSRGGRLRSSLPIIRSRSRSRERPLGVIYLEYSGESRPAVLPNEVTSLDTIRALFVQGYPGLLTMPMLNPQHHSLQLKNRQNGTFSDIENVSRIKDRAIIRARPTGIPTPGGKKSASNNDFKLKSAAEQNNRNICNKQQTTDDITVEERNVKNLNHKSGLKAPVKSLIRQYHSSPSTAKPAVSGANSFCSDTKINSRLPQKTPDAPARNGKGNAPDPPPRSAKPTIPTKPSAAPTSLSNGKLRSGNGLGGGSIPHEGFSYLKQSPTRNGIDENQESFTKPPNISKLQAKFQNNSRLETEHASRLSPLSDDLSDSLRKTPPAKETLDEKVVVTSKTLIVQPRQYAGSSMASQTKYPFVSSSSTQIPPRPVIPRGLQPRSQSMKQSSNSNSKPNLQPNLSPPLVSSRHPEATHRNLSPELGNKPGLGLPTSYSRGSRFGNQPKPFSIPVVPDVTSGETTFLMGHPAPQSTIKEPSSPDSQLKASPTVNEKNNGLDSSDNATSSGDELSGKETNRNNGSKKGLFGLRRLVTSKSSPKPNRDSPKSGTPVAESKSVQSEVSVIKETFTNKPSSSFGLSYSTVSSGASPRLKSSTSRGKYAPSKPSPLAARKAAIPKSDLIHSLLTNKNETGEVSRESLSTPPLGTSSFSSETTSSSDDDKERTDAASSPSSGIAGLTGVLKNTNLVKSTSSSSILTDSGSNLSATPSVRTKKVSFQDNVTVCDANGISTFSNSLRQPDDDREAATGADGFHGYGAALDQSLSQDANEVDSYQNENDASRSWRGEAFNRSVARKDFDAVTQMSAKYRPTTPQSHDGVGNNYPFSYVGNSFSSPHSSNYPRVTHQSAVAAAIQSISGNTVASSVPQLKNVLSRCPKLPTYEQYAVSCTSPVTLVTRQDHVSVKQNEEWSSLQQRTSPETPSSNPRTDYPVSMTPVTGVVSKDLTQLSEKVEPAKATKMYEPSYFQTQGTALTMADNKESFNSNTPPYYECCESSIPSSQPVNVTHVSKALAKQSEQQLAESDVHNALPPGGVIESQLADLSGKVEAITTTAKDTVVSSRENLHSQAPLQTYAESPRLKPSSLNQQEMRQKLLKLRETAHDIKEQLNDVKKQQRLNMERVNDLVKEKTRDLTQFIASTAGAQHRPLRQRRLRLDQERQTYGMNASRTEKQLSDVEAAVEELRNEVVERRCRVNAREVEALVLQLSQAGRTVAQLKGSFPALCDEMRTVGAAETEIIYVEEKFVEAEPSRLDEQLKRCKQLTTTLFTLKKLATVQEARSRTPTSFAQQHRPLTPSHPVRGGAWENTKVNQNRVLQDVRRIRPDHGRRMDSIQRAEISWTRRRKIILEYDSKKFEKALEIAEKALRRTDYISQNERRRRAHLVDLYNDRHLTDAPSGNNFIESRSSSIESLPPPPPPAENLVAYSPNLPLPPRCTHPVPPGILPPPPPDLKLPGSAAGDGGYSVISPDVGYLSSDASEFGRVLMPRNNTGSLPRYARTPHQHPWQGVPTSTGRSYQAYSLSERQSLAQQMDRPNSVTPHQWNAAPGATSAFPNDDIEMYEMTEEERQRYLEQQQLIYLEKNLRLKEQYSKLQQMQKRQRMSLKKPSSSHTKSGNPGVYRSTVVSLAAKSSDV